ncbi:MAG: hypothetical protein ABEJ72_06920 [Candidatus Aenigmatarchaeota archaeon]
MAGAILHIISAFLVSGLIYGYGYAREFVFAGFIGALFPDIFKYFILGVYYGNLDIMYILRTPIWKGMKEITLWEINLTFGLLFAGIALLFYEIHVLNEKNFWEVEKIDYFLVLGILVHLVIDLFWIESGYLI